jgi:hypothetical protein
VNAKILNNTVDAQFRAINDSWPFFAFAHDLGTISTTAASITPIVYAVGHVRDPLAQLLNIPNTNIQRGAYYLTRYNSISDVVGQPSASYVSRIYRAPHRSLGSSAITPTLWLARKKFDDDLTSAAFAATPQDTTYWDILALSVRQMFANIELTAGWDGATHVSTDIMAFLKGM